MKETKKRECIIMTIKYRHYSDPYYNTHRPLLFCMLGLAPVLSKASAMRAMPLITSALCFFRLKEQTRCSGVSTAPTVAALTWAE